MLWEGPKYLKYEGECMDQSRQHLDDTRRKAIWTKLQQNLKDESGSKIRLNDSANNLLNHSDVHELKWNGHTTLQCFNAAIALAESDSKKHPESREDEVIIVDAEHFKDAINTTETKWTVPTADYSSDDDTNRRNKQRKRKRKERPAREKSKLWPLSSDADIGLCIPQLHRAEWDSFKAAASDDFFRKTKFYAIDVLLKEPIIKFQAGQKSSRRRKALTGSITEHGGLEHEPKAREELPTTNRGQAPLPERIRINSTTILKVFQEINEEGDIEAKGSTLFFRPFRSLVYYEPEFRGWVSRQEAKLQGLLNSPQKPETSQGSPDSDVNGPTNNKQRSDMDIDKEKAALDNVRCQLTFFDDYIKPKQDFLRTAIYDTVTFADIWYMFNPGDTVIDRLNGQAYRVIEVKSIKHRVRKPSKEMPNFWRDDSTAEFKDNPVFVHCIYVDFNGAWMGPVNRVFCISRFPNSKPVSTLPIYPARFAVDDGLEDDLVQRGKLFVEVAKVKHMHYSGLTLQTHDEVDSQVVVDFEEAFNRNPDWKPDIQSVFSVDMEDMMEAVTVDPVFTRTTREKDDDDSDVVVSWCVEECCEKETSHDDEYIEARLRDEQIGTRMSSSTSTVASVAIVPRDFSSPSRDVAFDKDELMIMAHRVPGFVLRNRKWAWLDLKNMTEVAVIGEDEGFGQLVLPSGHKDMVKSMIRQHFKNRKHMKDESNKTDIVRGKGDLGTTAKEVEEALETNFALAHRWNCILLIDEADVFLAERTRDDFVRNSLVAVSTIPPLKRDATREIFQKNIERTKERYELNAREIDIREYDITKFAGDYYDDNKDARWNGRQIRNAFHSAIALAELEANDGEGDTDRAVVLSASHFGTVAAAYKAFTDYLHQTYGVDPARRARENVWRSDNFGQARAPNALTTRLNVADPRPPAPPPPPPGAPWPPQANYAGYGAGNDPRFAYPPGYPAYSYAPPDASYPTAAPGQPRDPMTGQMPYAAHAGSMARPTEHYTGGPHTENRQPQFPGQPSTGPTGGQGNAMS
ncbi:hypothetical protein PG988_003327 [Apiospora saccharicola]